MNCMSSLKPIVMGTFSVNGMPARVFGLESVGVSMGVVWSFALSFLVMPVVWILTLASAEPAG